MIIEYDRIDTWAPLITEVLNSALPGLSERLVDMTFRCSSDARSFLETISSPTNLLDLVMVAFENCSMRFYHGSRLSSDEIDIVMREGLKPLCIKTRVLRLTHILMTHPMWSEKSQDKLAKVLSDRHVHDREDNYVYAGISRECLLRHDNHYLGEGSEFDSHVARSVFCDDLMVEILKRGRSAVLFSFVVPFHVAVKATQGQMRPGEQLMHFPGEMLAIWAFCKAQPSYDITAFPRGSNSKFPPIPPYEIESFALVDDATLGKLR